MPATPPINSADGGVTKPDAGVIATSPATRPEHNPSSDGRRRTIHSANIHAIAPAAAAMGVTAIARPARPSDATAEPALKPNQPTHNSPAPAIVSPRLNGSKG